MSLGLLYSQGTKHLNPLQINLGEKTHIWKKTFLSMYRGLNLSQTENIKTLSKMLNHGHGVVAQEYGGLILIVVAVVVVIMKIYRGGEECVMI